MKKGNGCPRPILVQFTNYYIRDKLYRSRTKLHRANVGNFINGANRVFTNDNLIALRSKLFKKVRDKNEDHSNWRTWTLDGKIYIKTNPACGST